MRSTVALIALFAWTLVSVPGFAQPKRPLNVDDLFNVREVADPQCSPDGQWVAYTVTRAIKDTDTNDTDVWMVSWDGQQQIQVTSTPEAESMPRWSPDNKYLAFVSARQGAKDAQVWLLHRAGGEAVKLTEVKGGVSDYAWAPDAKRLVLVVDDPDPLADAADADTDRDKKDPAPKTPKPIVIDRYRFKKDIRGYLRGERSHLYLFDLASKKADRLTTGGFDEEAPAWSPDGSQVAFIRTHGEGDVDRTANKDLFAIEARPGALARRLTTSTGTETGRVSWSPDARWIACLLGDELKWSIYDQQKLVPVPASGGQPRVHHRGVHLDQPRRHRGARLDSQAVHLCRQPEVPDALAHPRRARRQDENAFNFERELFAANGYLVVAVNYRGSIGRGIAFQRAISRTGATRKWSICWGQ